MKSKLNIAFIRAVINKVEDCSSPIQLRAYLNRYRDFVFAQGIKDVFTDKLEFFRIFCSGDSLALKTIDDLQDMLEFEIQVAEITKTNLLDVKDNNSKKERAVIANTEDVIDNMSVNKLKQIIIRNCGNIDDISLEINIKPNIIKRRINKLGLSSFMRHHSRKLR